tara:strand:+ start:704 stop:1552 length:849 start_codon:yes stop_codon:yes gene_type:complete
MSKGNKVLQAVVDQIIERIEETGILPWQQPWVGANTPMNYEHKNPYRGLNRWSCILAGFSDNRWLTFSQIQKLEGKIKKGEKHTKIMKVAMIEKKRENDKGEQEVYARWFQPVRYYKMWNLEQTEGIDAEALERGELKNPIDACEEVIGGFFNSPSITHSGNSAKYSVDNDTINMPKVSSFEKEEDYYSTLFRIMAHSTGHPDRLNRRTLVEGQHPNTAYSKEQLVAELTSSMLCAHCGIEKATIKNSSAYLSGWLNKLKAQPKMLMASAGMAEKAFKHIVQ